MDEREISSVYAIPANYTDSGKLFGGMLETRNTIEAVILAGLIGYPEFMWLHIPGTVKTIVMVVTLLPLGVLALMGVAGDSLCQYFMHMCRHWFRRRNLHLRRIGYRYETEQRTKSKSQARKLRRARKGNPRPKEKKDRKA